jgi:predicted regulator of Ras-like GTPase activity (Roadblock/LC7/MglB family)
MLIDISQAVNAILVDFIKSTRGIKQIMLADETGLVISKVSKELRDDVDFEGLASIATATYLCIGMWRGEFELGDLVFNLTDFKYGNLCILGIKDGFIIIAITHNNASLQKVKQSLKRLSIDLSKQLDLLKTSKGIEKKQIAYNEMAKKKNSEDLEKILQDLDF